MRLLERCDALRRPERFAEVLLACECDARGRLGLEEQAVPAARAPGRGAAPGRRGRRHGGRRGASARGAGGPAIGEAIHDARVDALRDLEPPLKRVG